jgi:uncharacterized protein (DUF736 family)
MTMIGLFTPTKDGGWIGSIQTLTTNTKLRFAPNDNHRGASSPVFQVFVGHSRVGEAWDAHLSGENSRDYLRVRLYDPCLPEPINAALLLSDDGKIGQLLWNRRRTS